jgi:hypothetical protein
MLYARTSSAFLLSVILSLASALLACSGSGEGGPSGSGSGVGGDGAGGASATSGPAGSGGAGQGGGRQGGDNSGGGGGSGSQGPCDFPHTKEVDVADADGLSAALSGAAPGTLIRLAPGVYSGEFKATVTGTAGSAIILCGPRDAVLDAGSTSSGYVLHLDMVDHWILSGFTVTRGLKGVMLDRSNQNLLTGLLVHDIGQEAVHFRTFSSQNTITLSEIRDTGRDNPGIGEGVYLGSAVSNWPKITGSSGTPDTSDGNRVIRNVFGPGITAEHIDIKEGTTGGEVRGNTFHGAGISGENYADSWMDVKGSGYLIAENTGNDAPLDGFQTHVAVDGWGNDNVFTKNIANVNGPGYGFSILKSSQGNVVRCDNEANGAGMGLANVDCVP